MSPSDLGSVLKPFVFLDIFDADKSTVRAMADMPIHPHSGIATVTVITEGHMKYDDPVAGSGALAYGGVEWMRAGGGVWHGKEMSPGHVPRIQGFQLWVALRPDLENSEPQSRYIPAEQMGIAGPAYVIVGNHEGVQSPVLAPDGINYLLVTLRPDENWMYRPPAGHSVAWLALAKGALQAGTSKITAGEMAIFQYGEEPIAVRPDGKEAVFVLGSAVPHPYPLHLGNYSVHTSSDALSAGEKRITELHRRLEEAGNRSTASGTVPVFR
jgi:redox-sensitive bicupin YhaK (pirin superfamily)